MSNCHCHVRAIWFSRRLALIWYCTVTPCICVVTKTQTYTKALEKWECLHENTLLVRSLGLGQEKSYFWIFSSPVVSSPFQRELSYSLWLSLSITLYKMCDKFLTWTFPFFVYTFSITIYHLPFGRWILRISKILQHFLR